MEVVDVAGSEQRRVPNAGAKRRPRAVLRYPVYDLEDSIAVAKAVLDQGGGVADPDRLAIFLRHKSTKSGSFLARIAAARLYGLISKTGERFELTARGRCVLTSGSPSQISEALLDAFMDVPLFAAVYEEFRGRELPPEAGLKNFLQQAYAVSADSADVAYRTIMESAAKAGFFEARGTRTHLIMPRITKQSASGAEMRPPDSPDEGVADQVDGRFPLPQPLRTVDSLRNDYVAMLIELAREKGKKSGEVDLELLERIERLLDMGDK
jgi:hypothetical protein